MSKRIAIMQAIVKLGTIGKAAPEPSQDPADNFLHAYLVAAIGESHYKKTRSDIRTSIFNQYPDKLHDIGRIVDETKKFDASVTEVLIEGANYQFQVTSKRGAEIIDTKKLVTELRKRFSADVVDELVKKCTVRREPSMSYTVTEKE